LITAFESHTFWDVEGFVLVRARSLQKIKGEIFPFLITELTHTPLEGYPLLSRRIVDQIDLAPLTFRFLGRVQLLRESTKLFWSAPHLLHDTSYLSCAGAVPAASGSARTLPTIQAARRIGSR
jgi:hypothetical protein